MENYSKPTPPSKAKRTRTAAKAKASPKPGVNRATKAAIRDLTPDRLRHLWSLHNPDRPETRAMLEKLFRQSR